MAEYCAGSYGDREPSSQPSQSSASPRPETPALPPVLSIVLPAYNEAENLQEVYASFAKVLDSLNLPWELIIADDGSRDGTWREIVALHQADRRVKGVQLSRNFGHQYALFAGLSHASGAAIISMDADLQHPPELVRSLVERWRAGYKIVNTVRLDPPTLSIFKRTTSALYYRALSKLSGVPMRKGMSDCRLLDRQVLQELMTFGEAGLFLRGLVMWMGYPTTWVPFECRDRLRGQSKYTLKKMVLFALDGITSFSVIPLRIGVFVGCLTSLLAFLELTYALTMKLSGARTVPGWASAVSVVSFLFGVLFILLGLIGEYIGRILVEVRHRPRFIVNASLGLDHEDVQRPLIAQETPHHVPVVPSRGSPP
jgi:glycosyltransferase involved in cell wall biosynthesis